MPKQIDALIFDYAGTISSARYFRKPCPGVPDWDGLVQELVFGDPDYCDAWMRGEITLVEVACRIADGCGGDWEAVLDCLAAGCAEMPEQASVIGLARALKARGVPIGLVTINMDVFTEVVVPRHGYDRLFDVIVNSADHGTIDKTQLWPRAFAALGAGVGYANSLLIDDSEHQVLSFRAKGGSAIRYLDEGSIAQGIGAYRIGKGAFNPLP